MSFSFRPYVGKRGLLPQAKWRHPERTYTTFGRYGLITHYVPNGLPLRNYMVEDATIDHWVYYFVDIPAIGWPLPGCQALRNARTYDDDVLSKPSELLTTRELITNLAREGHPVHPSLDMIRGGILEWVAGQ